MSRNLLEADIRWAKPLLEHEEGMNHLWVRIWPLAGKRTAWVQLQLPEGIFLDDSACGYKTDERGRIAIEAPATEIELLFGIYTEKPVPCGGTAVVLKLDTQDNAGEEYCECWEIPLQIVDAVEAELLEPELDEEVVRKVKEQAARRPAETGGPDAEQERLDCTPAKVIRYDASRRTELEKEYWVEG